MKESLARTALDATTDDVALWAPPGGKIRDHAELVSKLASANDVLGRFHDLRRQDVKDGKTPTRGESMQRLERGPAP